VQDFEAYEHAYNIYPPGGVATGVLTVDGVHPCEVVSDEYPFCPIYTHGDYAMANAFAKTLLQVVGERRRV
jgi:hypothetical protein